MTSLPSGPGRPLGSSGPTRREVRINLEARVIFTDHIYQMLRVHYPEITLDEVMLISYQ